MTLPPYVVITCQPDDIIPTNPPQIAPEFLTEEEAAIYMRLNRRGAKDPSRSMRDLAAQYSVPTLKSGLNPLYPLAELKKLKRAMWTKQHPRIPYPG